jgi:hypothetical protein
MDAMAEVLPYPMSIGLELSSALPRERYACASCTSLPCSDVQARFG